MHAMGNVLAATFLFLSLARAHALRISSISVSAFSPILLNFLVQREIKTMELYIALNRTTSDRAPGLDLRMCHTHADKQNEESEMHTPLNESILCRRRTYENS